jgi:hypothetical protein
MMMKMRHAIHQLQILWAVVIANAVLVVDYFRVQQRTTKDLLHHHAMNQPRATAIIGCPVSVREGPPAALPRRIFGAGQSSIPVGDVSTRHRAEVSIALVRDRVAALFAIHAPRIAQTSVHNDLGSVVAHRLATLQKWGYLRGVV